MELIINYGPLDAGKEVYYNTEVSLVVIESQYYL
jgi:hypothetical protein